MVHKVESSIEHEPHCTNENGLVGIKAKFKFQGQLHSLTSHLTQRFKLHHDANLRICVGTIGLVFYTTDERSHNG